MPGQVMRYGRWQLVLVAGMLALSACARQAVSTETSIPGAPRPSVGSAPGTVGAATGRGTVEAFLKAVNAQDLQAMSAYWGNQKGPARDQISREELEKRLVVMQCHMSHDKYAFAEAAPRLQTGGRQDHLVDITKGTKTVRISMITVQGQGGRWFLEDVSIEKLSEFCR